MIDNNKVRQLISEECDATKEHLLKKNHDYGNSFAEPLNIFSESNPEEQLNNRLDDKLKRIKFKDKKLVPEDTELDIIGYLILKRVLRRI